MRSRGYVFTINNYSDLDMAQVILLQEISGCDYICAGFEVGESGTPHIQGYVHFACQKEVSTINNALFRASVRKQKAWIDSDAYKYTQKDGDYWEWGARPQGGKNSSAIQNKIIEMVKQGASYREINELFPAYCLHNGSKLKAYISSSRKSSPKFYVCKPIEDAITEIYDYFNLEEIELHAAVVTELCQLEAYDDYNAVIYYADYEKIHALWPRGAPITYKYGYQIKVVHCQYFIVVTNTTGCYPLYKNI